MSRAFFGEVSMDKMESITPNEKEAIIELYKTNLQGLLQSNNAMIDYSKMSLRGTMILNGAGIIPIVYSKVDYLYDTALLFGCGALCSVIASAVSYLVQWAITTHWDGSLIRYPFRTSSLSPEEEKAELTAIRCRSAVPWLRGTAIVLVVLSLGCFARGLYEAHSDISSIQEIQSTAKQASEETKSKQSTITGTSSPVALSPAPSPTEE